MFIPDQSGLPFQPAGHLVQVVDRFALAVFEATQIAEDNRCNPDFFASLSYKRDIEGFIRLGVAANQIPVLRIMPPACGTTHHQYPAALDKCRQYDRRHIIISESCIPTRRKMCRMTATGSKITIGSIRCPRRENCANPYP
ncbi:MAG: hypothetical protein BGP09_36330 [Rhizobium sp. 60-20]|nr:MAG: hypothetical protein BGP09_36330 [Rhizobium sp. 60-20]